MPLDWEIDKALKAESEWFAMMDKAVKDFWLRGQRGDNPYDDWHKKRMKYILAALEDY